MYTVWAGGVEVTDYYISKEAALEIAEDLISAGYDEVQIEQVG